LEAVIYENHIKYSALASYRKVSVPTTQIYQLTLTLLTWRIWWVPNNARRWQMGFNSAFKGLILLIKNRRLIAKRNM